MTRPPIAAQLARAALLALALALASALLAGGCGKAADEDVDPAQMRVPVTVFEVRRDTLTAHLALTGRIDPVPGGRVLLTAPAPAVVGRMATTVGAPVQRGQVLIELDAPDLAAEATAKTAEADAARSEARRQEDLLREGISARKQAEEATAAAQSADAAARAARGLLARTHIASPIAGIVDRVFVQQGERVDTGGELVSVVNGSTVDFAAPVPLADLVRVRPGQAVSVTIAGIALSQSGTVQAVAPAVDSVTNAGRVLVRLPNRGGLLRIGASASAVVDIESRRNVLVVPKGALVPGDTGTSVLVVRADSTVELRAVEVGVEDNGLVEVSGPLKAGERVVVEGGYGLETGMRVRVGTRARP